MNPTILHRRRAERFAQLVDQTTSDRRRRPRSRLDTQLAELVAVGERVSALPIHVDIDPDFRTGLRAMLVATAEREGIGRTSTTTESPQQAGARRLATWRTAATRRGAEPGPNRRPSRSRTRGAIVVGVAIGVIAVSGISAASEDAVPGDPLYSVKRSSERAQLALSGSDVTRGQLHLRFARTRAGEATVLRPGDGAYVGVLNDMDADTMRGVRLLTAIAVERRDRAALEVIDAFVTGQRASVDTLAGRVDGADRERTRRSLALLDAVDQRVDGLRATLSCDTPAAGTDALGPKPRSCATGAGTPGGEPRRPRGRTG
ncbi:MAG TPA: DUF5667 domain-containing protein [Pilimelia sp.]|nr:DUF5667 domain-containing protein [Pilimelia sp.]